MSMSVGGSSIGFSSVSRWLFERATLSEQEFFILDQIRFPRTMACVFVGAALALGGTLLQTQLGNPLADPYTLGLSGAASLGGSLTFLFGFEPYWIAVPAGAFLFCWVVTAILLFLLKRNHFGGSKTFILLGVVISLFCGSMVNISLALLEPSKLQNAFFWLVGQVGSARDSWWPLLAAILLFSIIYFFKTSKNLDHLLLGDEVAQSLGTNVLSFRRKTIAIVALLSSLSVAIAGVMGFVGLISGHYASRLLKTRRHKELLFVSVLMGGNILLYSDIMGRFLGGELEIPAGSITAIVGAPIFLSLLVSRKARYE